MQDTAERLTQPGPDQDVEQAGQLRLAAALLQLVHLTEKQPPPEAMKDVEVLWEWG